MGDKSAIEWTDATWNPVTGCTQISAGCKHCYAKALHEMRMRALAAGKQVAGKQYEQPFEVVQLHENRLANPLKWQRPRRIFVDSGSDLFHPDVPFAFIDRIFAVMALASHHTFQILTKRPERMLEYIRSDRAMVSYWMGHYVEKNFEGIRAGMNLQADFQLERKLPNVWLGVSVEDAGQLKRVEVLQRVPADWRFLSCEPMLRGFSLAEHLDGIHLVIDGGESGACARPMHPDWPRQHRDECAARGVWYMFKQWGEWIPVDQMPDGEAQGCAGYPKYRHVPTKVIHADGRKFGITDPGAWPMGAMPMQVMRIGKQRAGRLLDGVLHDGVPAAAGMVRA